MKTMTCNELGGACDVTFQAATFDEIAAMSRRHGQEMAEKGDAAHLAAMQTMRDLMTDPAAMRAWFEEVQQAFADLPED